MSNTRGDSSSKNWDNNSIDDDSYSLPTLWSVPMIFLVYGSYTIQPRLEKCKSRPSSHNCLIDTKFRDNLRTKKVLGSVKKDVKTVLLNLDG